jgi:hypothetical protein
MAKGWFSTFFWQEIKASRMKVICKNFIISKILFSIYL